MPHAPAAPRPSGPRVRLAVEVEVAKESAAPALRGFLVVQRLARLGEVVSSSPGLDDLRAGRLPDRRLSILLESAAGRAETERLLSLIGGLATVTVREECPPRPIPARGATGAGAGEEGRTVRVRVELLDAFLDTVGELLLATSRLRELERALPAELRPPLEEGVDHLSGTVNALHDQVMAVRMTPLAAVAERLPRVARDLARTTGKEVELSILGADIAIDRTVLDELSDLLIHLVRNAVDHGLELPELRLAAGKPATGSIALAARRERDQVVLELTDDGRGMDAERLRAVAVARGALSGEAAAALPESEALLLACLPGVSTARAVTELSGRGVGLDAVKRGVDAMGGRLEIASVRGASTRFTLRLPVSLAVQKVLLAAVGDEVLGFPVARVRAAAEAELTGGEGEAVLQHGGARVPVRELSELLGFSRPPPKGKRTVVLAESEGALLGLAVDRLLGQADAVLKPLAQPLQGVAGLSAVTILGNGRPVFILDVAQLVAG